MASNSGLPSDGLPLVNSRTDGVMTSEPGAQAAGVDELTSCSGQLGSVKYPPSPLLAPLLRRPRNRSSRPLEIGSMASAGSACTAIAVGLLSSTVVTQEPTVGLPMSARKVARVSEPSCGKRGMMVSPEVPPTWVHVVSV